MKTTATIEMIFEPSTPKAPWTAKTADGERFKWWEDSKKPIEGLELLKKGNTVEIAYDSKKNGEYTDNFVTGVKSAGGSSAPTTHGVGMITTGVDRETSIIKQSCLKAASNVGKDADEVIQIAEKFVAWVRESDPFAE